MKPKVAIFIPSYNGARTLPQVLDRIPASLKRSAAEIFVIDDASPDNSYLLAVGYKHSTRLPNLQVFKNPKNQGYGGNQKVAYKYAIKRGFDIVVMLHGDAQYKPEEVPKLIGPLARGEADMVFGSRMSSGMRQALRDGMPFYRYLGNRGLTAIENAVIGLDLSEFHSGFRAFRVDALRKIPLDKLSDNYHFDTEMLVQFHSRGLRIAEVPTTTTYRDQSHSPSLLDVIKYSWNILRTVGQYWLHKNGIRKYGKFS
jgi:glycosyltransferase involved in cell wall biosynthesis